MGLRELRTGLDVPGMYLGTDPPTGLQDSDFKVSDDNAWAQIHDVGTSSNIQEGTSGNGLSTGLVGDVAEEDDNFPA
jgi:hypothetical protein